MEGLDELHITESRNDSVGFFPVSLINLVSKGVLGARFAP